MLKISYYTIFLYFCANERYDIYFACVHHYYFVKCKMQIKNVVDLNKL